MTEQEKREKVIKGLECCTQHGSMCGLNCNGYWGWTDGSHTGMELFGEYRTKCPYGNCETGCVKTLTKDAIALLKAQEPVEPKVVDTSNSKLYHSDMFKNYYCGNCGEFLHIVDRKDLFCSQCGQAVKWDD